MLNGDRKAVDHHGRRQERAHPRESAARDAVVVVQRIAARWNEGELLRYSGPARPLHVAECFVAARREQSANRQVVLRGQHRVEAEHSPVQRGQSKRHTAHGRISSQQRQQLALKRA
jgi:hypothetical protein